MSRKLVTLGFLSNGKPQPRPKKKSMRPRLQTFRFRFEFWQQQYFGRQPTGVRLRWLARKGVDRSSQAVCVTSDLGWFEQWRSLGITMKVEASFAERSISLTRFRPSALKREGEMEVILTFSARVGVR